AEIRDHFAGFHDMAVIYDRREMQFGIKATTSKGNCRKPGNDARFSCDKCGFAIVAWWYQKAGCDVPNLENRPRTRAEILLKRHLNQPATCGRFCGTEGAHHYRFRARSSVLSIPY